jgi:hypothetical protein
MTLEELRAWRDKNPKEKAAKIYKENKAERVDNMSFEKQMKI